MGQEYKQGGAVDPKLNQKRMWQTYISLWMLITEMVASNLTSEAESYWLIEVARRNFCKNYPFSPIYPWKLILQIEKASKSLLTSLYSSTVLE